MKSRLSLDKWMCACHVGLHEKEAGGVLPRPSHRIFPVNVEKLLRASAAAQLPHLTPKMRHESDQQPALLKYLRRLTKLERWTISILATNPTPNGRYSTFSMDCQLRISSLKQLGGFGQSSPFPYMCVISSLRQKIDVL